MTDQRSHIFNQQGDMPEQQREKASLPLEPKSAKIADYSTRDLFFATQQNTNTLSLLNENQQEPSFLELIDLLRIQVSAKIYPEKRAKLGQFFTPSPTAAFMASFFKPLPLLVKRFSSKEEKRRITAILYEPSALPAHLIGFENHLNYYHAHGKGLSLNLAKGLTAYLNSTIVDEYFRQFNGHTQVNATDLRRLPYPTMQQLETLGLNIDSTYNQRDLDFLVERELFNMADDTSASRPSQAPGRIAEALILFQTYNTNMWSGALKEYLLLVEPLIQRYAQARILRRILIQLPTQIQKKIGSC